MGASESKTVFTSVDPESKVGRRASLRQSLLTGEERSELVRRSLGMKPSFKVQSGLTRSATRIANEGGAADKSAAEQKAKPPPLEGMVRGPAWNQFVKETWEKDQPIVFHSILYSPSFNHRAANFSTAKITRDERFEAGDVGTIPDSVTHPTEMFEVFCEGEVRTRAIPAHFLVAGACAPESEEKDVFAEI